MKAWTVILLLVLAVAVFPRTGIPAENVSVKNDSMTEIDSVQKRRVLFSLQQEREKMRNEYEKKNQMLTIKEIELKTLEAEVDKKLTQLQTVRDQLRRLLEQKDEVEVQRIQGLSKMYEKMDPDRGAALMIKLDHELAVQVLAGMKAKSAGKLLSYMPAEKATRLSVAYSTLVED
ncbi:MAG: hypothetical protein P8X63_07170 [Desulfuromonadaceae bacterium]|jgi:flagellar motility protein MotE (MotC chaperone)